MRFSWALGLAFAPALAAAAAGILGSNPFPVTYKAPLYLVKNRVQCGLSMSCTTNGGSSGSAINPYYFESAANPPGNETWINSDADSGMHFNLAQGVGSERFKWSWDGITHARLGTDGLWVEDVIFTTPVTGTAFALANLSATGGPSGGFSSDTFTRPNTSDLSGSAVQVGGGTWEPGASSAFPDVFGVTSNKAVVVPTAGAALEWIQTPTYSPADATVTVSMPVPNHTNGGTMGVMIRGNGGVGAGLQGIMATVCVYDGACTEGVGTIQFREIVNGAISTSLGSASCTDSLCNGPGVLTVTMTGNSFTASWAGNANTGTVSVTSAYQSTGKTYGILCTPNVGGETCPMQDFSVISSSSPVSLALTFPNGGAFSVGGGTAASQFQAAGGAPIDIGSFNGSGASLATLAGAYAPTTSQGHFANVSCTYGSVAAVTGGTWSFEVVDVTASSSACTATVSCLSGAVSSAVTATCAGTFVANHLFVMEETSGSCTGANPTVVVCNVGLTQ